MIKPYYKDEWVTIYHGDCREILPQLDVRVDLVLTDPPYGIGENSAKHNSRHGLTAPTNHGKFHWDKKVDLSFLLTLKTNLIIWGGDNYTDVLPPSHCWLVWDKRGSDKYQHPFLSDCELAWTNLRGEYRSRVFRYLWFGMLQENMKNKDKLYHPTQKPVALFCWCINLMRNVDLILDPFLGSGTTAFCAKKLNRKCIGIEIEEKYCEIATKRCSQGVFDLSKLGVKL